MKRVIIAILSLVLSLSLGFSAFADEASELQNVETTTMEETAAEPDYQIPENITEAASEETVAEETTEEPESEEAEEETVPQEEITADGTSEEEIVTSVEAETSEETIEDETTAAEETTFETVSEETSEEETSSEEESTSEEDSEDTELLESSGTWGDLSWTLTTSGKLTISGSGNMDSFYSASSTYAWRAYRSQIKTVVIGTGVKSVGNHAFDQCTNLTSVTFSATVISIGTCAFSNTGLSSITLPKYLESMGEDIVSYTAITSITIPSTVNSANYYGSFKNSSIKKVTIESGMTSLPNRLCKDMTSLTSVTLPDSIASIGDYAFYGCTSLTGISFPVRVTTIGSYAFANTGLKTFILPLYIQTLGGRILEGSTGVTSVSIPSSLTSGDYAFSGSAITSASFEKGTTTVLRYLFCDAASLKKVTLPNTVQTIEYAAFNSTALTTINWPTSLTSIESYAFENTSVTSVNLSNSKSLTTIGQFAFDGCVQCTSITLPNSVTSIERLAFAGTAIESFKIPASLTRVEDRIFADVVTLREITIPKSFCDNCEYNGGMFEDSKIVKVTFETGVTTIPSEMCSDAPMIQSVYIPSTVTTIEEAAFYDCSTLADVYYKGTKSKRNKTLTIDSYGNDDLINATWHYVDYYVDISTLSQSFRDAINWMGENQYASSSTDYFNPSNPCTRLQTVVFLYRIAGSPSVSGTISFPDCQNYSKGSDSYKAILWATKKGIVNGYTNGNFGPNDSVTRKQILIILYRYAGQPKVSGKTGFSDVDGKFATTSDTYKAILWGTKSGITGGYADGRFGVNDTCLRRQIALFLYRYVN